MELRALAVVLICVIAIMIAGCTSGTPPATPEPDAPALTAPTPMNAMGCTADADCVCAQCCHPTSCINRVARPPCDGIACTMSCEGPLDCGAGTCGCVQGQCSIVPSQQETTTISPSLRIEASPQRYSPFMSSTPGIGLSVNASRIDRATTDFVWTASFGQLLSWNPPDYTVHALGATVTNHGEKLYWSFIDKPASTESPVVITVVARSSTGSELGRSTATLAWDGDYAVTVQQIA